VMKGLAAISAGLARWPDLMSREAPAQHMAARGAATLGLHGVLGAEVRASMLS